MSNLRIQFLVAAHTQPAFVARLCDHLAATPGAEVMVQWDCATAPPRPWPGRADLRPTRSPCGWGSGAQLDALLDSMRELATARFDWLVVLSGQDYPVRAGRELREHLATTPHQLFLAPEDGPVAPPRTPGAPSHSYLHDRYFYRYSWIPHRAWSRMPAGARRVVGAGLQRTVHALAPAGRVRVQRRPDNAFSPGIGVRADTTPFTAARPCRKGSDWFAMSRVVFDDLLAQVSAAPEVVEHFRRSYCPNESFFHTLLLPAWEDANAGHNLHHIRFVGERAHPETVRAADLDAIVESGVFFARKFDPADVALLDRIDRELLRA
jgi:hypothetical protein